jgi:hypothetical protein
VGGGGRSWCIGSKNRWNIRSLDSYATKDLIEQPQEEGFDVTFKVYVGAGHANYKPEAEVKKWLEKNG